MYAVKLKTGPRERRIFEKQAKQQQKNKTHFYKLKTGPIMLRNILGPVFNLYLDQFLTYKICYFFVFFVLWGAETPIFIVFSAKNTKFKETHRKEKRHYL